MAETAINVDTVDVKGRRVSMRLPPHATLSCQRMQSAQYGVQQFEKHAIAIVPSNNRYTEMVVSIQRPGTRGLSAFVAEGVQVTIERLLVSVAYPVPDDEAPAVALGTAKLVSLCDKVHYVFEGNVPKHIATVFTDANVHLQIDAKGTIDSMTLSFLMHQPLRSLRVRAAGSPFTGTYQKPTNHSPNVVDVEVNDLKTSMLCLEGCESIGMLLLPCLALPSADWEWSKDVLVSLGRLYDLYVRAFSRQRNLQTVVFQGEGGYVNGLSPVGMLYGILLPMICALCADQKPVYLRFVGYGAEFDWLRKPVPDQPIVRVLSERPAVHPPLRERSTFELMGDMAQFRDVCGPALLEIVRNSQPVGPVARPVAWCIKPVPFAIRAIGFAWYTARQMALTESHQDRLTLAQRAINELCPVDRPLRAPPGLETSGISSSFKLSDKITVDID